MYKSGILLIDKPKGITSHDVVDSVRRKLKMRRIGHAGTLDPLATGLLIILVGEATKRFSHFMNFDKEYMACLTLGEATDSGDSEGHVMRVMPYDNITKEQVSAVLRSLEGKIENVPPMISAIRYHGRRLYQLARKGITVERASRIVNIYKLDLVDFSLPNIVFNLKCSKGTYVRSLAEEIAFRLKCAGHITQIRRFSIGPYLVKDALQLDDFNENDIRPQ